MLRVCALLVGLDFTLGTDVQPAVRDANYGTVDRVNRGSPGDPPTVLAVITHALQETVLSAAAR